MFDEAGGFHSTAVQRQIFCPKGIPRRVSERVCDLRMWIMWILIRKRLIWDIIARKIIFIMPIT